jgi:hypothetical protein
MTTYSTSREIWKWQKRLFLHLLNLPFWKVLPTSLQVQNYHTNISDLHWPGTWYVRGEWCLIHRQLWGADKLLPPASWRNSKYDTMNTAILGGRQIQCCMFSAPHPKKTTTEKWGQNSDVLGAIYWHELVLISSSAIQN